MRIKVNGKLQKGVTAKDMILYIISQLSAGGATGTFVEYSGSAVQALSMEGRMTVCNMSIEMGARGGMIAPDAKTFEYLSKVLPANMKSDLNSLVKKWMELKTDEGAVFNCEMEFDAADIKPMITYGTNPSMAMAIDAKIPTTESRNEDASAFIKSLDYMGFTAGTKILGHPVDYVFLGSCTNGRIEDLRLFADFVRGRKKAPGITALIVPGSKKVEQQAIREGIADTLKASGFELRQPGCSSCLAMNEDKIPAGKYAVSTSNRNFEGRQGPGARTLLASPLTAAAAAVTGKITDPRDMLND
jgi:3-isopropylmalate/(R)-2-methylmalate dehydratase large subunit